MGYLAKPHPAWSTAPVRRTRMMMMRRKTKKIRMMGMKRGRNRGIFQKRLFKRLVNNQFN